MKLVLDASVALKFVLNERDSLIARKLQDEFRRGVHELITPDVFPVEVGNALTSAERKKLIPDGFAAILFADALDPAPVYIHRYR
ncbi:MAG: type II toxin-antitoxin system VapC family toxin [Planctomycetia bacterium]|nr:type II toxin-antitoxin system VapC family toxin [Planctomycetia bacterium]